MIERGIRKKTQVALEDQTGTNFIALLRMHFQRPFKSTLDRLKTVFNEFRRNPSVGALFSARDTR